MKKKINAIYSLLIASVILTAAIAWITYDNIREKVQSTDIIIHTYKTIQSSTQLLVLLMDMETSERGYIITGDSTFLNSYAEAAGMLEAETQLLRELIPDSKFETDFLEEKIFITSNNKHQDMENTLSVYNSLGRDSAYARLSKKAGKAMMDSIRIYVKHLVKSESEDLAQQHAILSNNKKLDPVRFSAFALITITCLLAFVTIIHKEKDNVGLLKKLKNTNEELEIKVEQRTRMLIEANQSKDHFLGIATHDLKAPINSILGLVGLMKLELLERTHTSWKEYLTHIEDSCIKMKHLITDVLDINSIEQGFTNVNKQPVELHAILSEMEREFAHQAKEKDITLIVDGINERVVTDPSLLSRILENLLSNAIKFSPEQRAVHLRAKKINDHILFEIQDEGPGISEVELPKLFKKFQKLANQPTRSESSTGLGLSIVKELTTLLNGEVTVTSLVGKGTTFMVSIPSPEIKELVFEV